jgi:hypothetical protein
MLPWIDISHSFISKYNLIPMSRPEFSKCPKCGVGTLRPSGGAAKMTDPDTGTVTGDYRGYKCDNPACDYPRGDEEYSKAMKTDLNVTDPLVAIVKNSDASGEGDTSSSISNKDDQQ